MAERKLVVKIVGDSQSLERAFTRSSRGAKNFEHDISKASRGALSAALSFRGLGRALAFGSFQFLGGAGVVFALKSTIAAAEESQKVLAQTANAVRRSGLSWQKYGDQVQEAALAQSNLSGFDDERLLGTFSNLVRRTGDVTQALKLNALATDVARGRNIELEAAQQLVLKASIGNVGALRRLGINVGKSASAYQALDLLQRKYAGSAEAYGRTASGAQDRFAVAIQNTQEAIGAALLPTLTVYLNKGADWLNNTENQRVLQERLTTAVQGTAAAIATIASAAQIAVQAIQTLSSVLGSIESSTPDWVKDFLKKNAAPGTALDAITGSHGVMRALRLFHIVKDKEPPNGGNFSDADLGLKPKQKAKLADLTGSIGKLAGITTPTRKGITAAQRNAFFDSALARQLNRAQDLGLKQQLTRLGEISKLISDRIAVTKDVTRKLNLEDQLIAVGRQAKGVREEIAQNLKDHIASQKARLEEQKARLEEIAATRLAQRTARQFRELGLNALGEERTPGVVGLKKRLQQLTANIAGTKLDTPKLQAQLSRFRKVLSEGLVPKDVRAKIREMMDGIADELKTSGARNQKQLHHINSQLFLQGITGLTRDQKLVLAARVSQIGGGGTVPGARSLAFSAAGASNPIVVHTSVNLDGKVVAKNVTKHQAKDEKRGTASRRGTYAGRH